MSQITIQEAGWWEGDCCRWHQLFYGRGQVDWVTIKSWHLGLLCF